MEEEHAASYILLLSKLVRPCTFSMSLLQPAGLSFHS